MHNKRRTTPLTTLAASVLAIALLGGCAQTRDLVSGLRKSPPAEGNAGILVFPGGDDRSPRYFPWDRVARVELDGD